MSGKKDGAATQTAPPRSIFHSHLVEQMLGAIRCPNVENEEVRTRYIMAAINRLNDIRPEGAVEGMLAVQMIATHDAAMDCLTRAFDPAATFDGREMNLKHATKLMAIYERQAAALDKRRGRGRHNVTVHVTKGGQAILGNVSHGGNAKAPESADPLALPAPDEPSIKISITDIADAALRLPAERDSGGPVAPSGKRRAR